MAKELKKCCEWHKWFALAVLLVGLWYLLADLGYDYTYGINWWSAVLVLVGAKMVYYKWFA